MQNNLKALASAEDPTETIKQVRSASTSIVGLIDTLAPFLEEGASKAALLTCKTNINTALAGLPADGAIGVTAQANALISTILGILKGAQETIQNLSTAAQTAVTQSRTALAGVPDQVKAGIDAAVQSQIAAGTLITKADHEAKLGTAKTEATTAAQSAFTAKLSKVSQRQSALATAGFSAPDNILLADDEATFTAWQAEQTARKAELEPFKLGADRVKALMGATKEAYTAAVALIKEVKPASSMKLNPLEGTHNASPATNLSYVFC